MLAWFKGLELAQRIAVAVLAAVIVLGAGYWLVNTITGGKRAEAEARLQGNRADAAIASASDVANAVASAAASEAAEDELTRENERAIRQAKGAAAPVDPAVRDAGLAGLCRRAAYRGSRQCLQFTPAPAVAPGRDGSAPSGR